MPLVEELEALLNRHSAENESNTPDFILAAYLSSCLRNINIVINERERWYGRCQGSAANAKAPRT